MSNEQNEVVFRLTEPQKPEWTLALTPTDEKKYRCSKGHEWAATSAPTITFSAGKTERTMQWCPLCVADVLAALSTVEEVREAA